MFEPPGGRPARPGPCGGAAEEFRAKILRPGVGWSGVDARVCSRQAPERDPFAVGRPGERCRLSAAAGCALQPRRCRKYVVACAVRSGHMKDGVETSTRRREVGEPLPVRRPSHVSVCAVEGRRDTARPAMGEVEHVDGAAPSVPLGMGCPRRPNRARERDPAAIRRPRRVRILTARFGARAFSRRWRPLPSAFITKMRSSPPPRPRPTRAPTPPRTRW